MHTKRICNGSKGYAFAYRFIKMAQSQVQNVNKTMLCRETTYILTCAVKLDFSSVSTTHFGPSNEIGKDANSPSSLSSTLAHRKTWKFVAKKLHLVEFSWRTFFIKVWLDLTVDTKLSRQVTGCFIITLKCWNWSSFVNLFINIQ